MSWSLAAEFVGGWRAVTVTLRALAKSLHATGCGQSQMHGTEGKAEVLRGPKRTEYQSLISPYLTSTDMGQMLL